MLKTNNPTGDIYGAIDRAYTHFNEHLFEGRLPACLIVLQRQPKMMGYVSHRRWVNDIKQYVDELAINPEYWLGHPLLEVMQTLVHEQCHVWQNHFGKPSRSSYHNREWADKMVDVGLIPSATGRPGGKRTGQHMNDYVLAGGAFQKAAEELMATGFGLPWLDRSVEPSERNAEIYDAAGVRADNLLSSESVIALTTPIGHVRLNVQSGSSEVNDIVGAANEPVLLEVATKKPTRVKYRCVDCGNQVWGRSKMKLICGECDQEFKQVD